MGTPHSHTSAHAISKTRVVCGIPEILYSVLPHLLQIHSLSTLLITFFIFTLVNCSVTLFQLFFYCFYFYIVTFGFHVPVTSLILQKIVWTSLNWFIFCIALASIIDLTKQLQCLLGQTMRLFGEYLFLNFHATLFKENYGIKLSYEFCENFKYSYFVKHLKMPASL